jgi:hypothetical protein
MDDRSPNYRTINSDSKATTSMSASVGGRWYVVEIEWVDTLQSDEFEYIMWNDIHSDRY